MHAEATSDLEKISLHMLLLAHGHSGCFGLASHVGNLTHKKFPKHDARIFSKSEAAAMRMCKQHHGK